MAGIFYGNTLTDLQSGMTASERNAGDTERAKVAADATKMSAYFSLLGSKAKTEADAHAHEAENARLYFATNLQDAQKKAELAQGADLASKQWAAQAQIAKDSQTARSRDIDAEIAGRSLDVKQQYPVGRVDERTTIEAMKEAQDQKMLDVQNQQQAQMAGALASQANLMLEPAKAKYAKTKSDAAKATQMSSYAWLPQSKVTGNQNSEDSHQKILSEADAVANKQFSDDISLILSKLGKDANSVVKFNHKANRFEPAIAVPVAATPSVRMIPPVMPGGFNPGAEGNAGFVMPPSSNPQWIRTANGQLIRSP